MKPFLETLNYTSSNEDSRSEISALEIEERDSVLCITGSGSRVLDLLIKGPALIIAIDFNPCQSFLLELKIAALQNLEYEEFLGFLGVRPLEGRHHIYQSIRHLLSIGASRYWDRHGEMITKGVIYQGRWERYFRMLAQFLHIARPRRLAKLFNSPTIGYQRKIWREEWDNKLWQLFLRTISSRAMWQYVLGDPGFYRHVPSGFSVSRYLREKLTFAYENTLVSDSPFLTLLFLGKYNAGGPLPLHLQEKYFMTLKERLGCIKIVTQSLSDYLEQCGKRQFHKYSLSDISSYTDQSEYVQIWDGIIKTALPGAIICERQFLIKRATPANVMPLIKRNIRLEKDLELTDDSIFYSFVVASIAGDGSE